MDSYPRAAAVARATSRAAYLNINAGRPATPEHETQRAVTRRSAYYDAAAARSRRAPRPRVRNRRGARRGRVDAGWSTFGHLHVGAGHTRFLTLHTSGQSPHRTVIRPRLRGGSRGNIAYRPTKTHTLLNVARPRVSRSACHAVGWEVSRDCRRLTLRPHALPTTHALHPPTAP